ncbi:MAG: ABC transporter permease [Lachnospiraceae bacterium]|nr:ABC transporter permease [Lachnospiraceae bacterium]
MLSKIFSSDAIAEALTILKEEIPFALWETSYVTVLATAFAIVLGLPLGVLLVAGEKNGVRPLPKGVMHVLNVVINLLRSIPFLILMILVFPLTRLIVGTSVGTTASIVPLVIAAFPFVARLVESSLREINPNIIEMAQSMGASPMQIIVKVMIPESIPSLISNFTIAITTVLGYTAMSGIIGGGGLGKIAINYGYYRYKYLVMLIAVIILIVLVQVFQSIGTRLAVKLDRRVKH